MKTLVTSLLAAGLAVVFAAPSFAVDGEGEEQKIKLPPQAQQLINAVQKLELTDTQQQHVQKVQQQHAPQFQQHVQTQQSIFTPEQKKNRKQYTQQGKDDGLEGKELRQFVQSKLELTPEQNKQFTQCQTNIAKQQSKFRAELTQVLTPDQIELLPAPGKKGKGKRGKRNKDKGPAQEAPK